MPDSQWIPSVRSAGVLRFERGRTLQSGAWPAVITASVTEINALLGSRRVDLRFEPAGESGSQLQIEATAGPIPARAGGGALHSSGRDGATRVEKVGRSGASDSQLRIRRGWIYLPVAPAGRRVVLVLSSQTPELASELLAEVEGRP